MICEFALKDDCGEFFEQRCERNSHMQLHAAALHSHCLSTSLLLNAILHRVWLFKETFNDAASVLADFLLEAAPAARHGRAMLTLTCALVPNARVL